MDKKTLKSNWDQLRGHVKKTWAKLSDNQLEKIEGDFDKFVDAVEKTYGFTASEAATAIKNFLNKEGGYSEETSIGAGIRKAGEKINEFSETVAAKSDRAVHQGEETVNAVHENVSRYLDSAIDYTKKHPLKVTLIAAGVGYVFAKFFSKK